MSQKAKFLMFSVVNVSMALAMNVTASIIHRSIGYKTVPLVFIGYAVGMVLSYLIPFGIIGEWFSNTLHAKNLIFRSIASNIIPAVINTAIIGLIMTLINVPLAIGLSGLVKAYFSDIWILCIVATAVACFVNPLAIKVGIKADGRKKEDENRNSGC
ncbi:MAG: hypothetical protein ACI3XS_07010 [Eubacteriales bacterium]